jgi:beta-N-acetylhexosaminidase
LKGDTTILSLDSMANTAIVSIGVTKPTVFQNELSRHYKNSAIFLVDKNSALNKLDSLQNILKQYNQVIISINDTRLRPQSKLNYSNDVKAFIAQLAAGNNSVISVFANAYTIAGLPGIEKAGALLVAYQMSDDLQLSAVKVIIHQLKPTGKLPVRINSTFPSGAGFILP